MKETKTKKSQLVFEPKITRKLLKMNEEIKFCPVCGKPIEENCGCHMNMIIDYKPYRNSDGAIEPDRSVPVFLNTSTFQADYAQLVEEAKAKREAEVEKPEADLD